MQLLDVLIYDILLVALVSILGIILLPHFHLVNLLKLLSLNLRDSLLVEPEGGTSREIVRVLFTGPLLETDVRWLASVHVIC